MKKKSKFKSRYVLGEGYPWINSIDVGMAKNMGVDNVEFVKLKTTPELDETNSICPKYRLVIEKIKK
ncbi:MAG: hypothetical protein ACYDBV_15425 [Nitrospiria bacterium]